MRALLDARQNGIAEQLTELRALRGKNQDVVEHMMERVRQEKELFERGLQRFTALRTVFSQQTNQLFDVIGLDALRDERRPHAAPHRGQPVHQGRARRDERVLRDDPRAISTRPRGAAPRSTT